MQQRWPDDIWAIQLAGLLLGDALDAFASIPAVAALSYARVKEAILARFKVNAQRVIASASAALATNWENTTRCC